MPLEEASKSRGTLQLSNCPHVLYLITSPTDSFKFTIREQCLEIFRAISKVLKSIYDCGSYRLYIFVRQEKEEIYLSLCTQTTSKQPLLPVQKLDCNIGPPLLVPSSENVPKRSSTNEGEVLQVLLTDMLTEIIGNSHSS